MKTPSLLFSLPLLLTTLAAHSLAADLSTVSAAGKRTTAAVSPEMTAPETVIPEKTAVDPTRSIPGPGGVEVATEPRDVVEVRLARQRCARFRIC